jgi:competence protein ComEC
LLLVNLPHFPEVNYGDEIKLSGTIMKPGKFDSFDYGQYLKRYLIFGVVNSPSNITDSGLSLNPFEKVKRELFYVSDYFENSLNRILPEPNASLAAGLILGIKRNIPESFKNDLSTTGLTHIIALSGYNVTIIVAVFSSLLLGILSRKRIFILGTVLVILFVLMTGAASSVVRAAIFSLLVIFGRTIGRQADFTNLLILAAVVMILLNPYVLRLDVGFQLSFLAFSGLVYLSPIVKKFFERKSFAQVPEFIKSILTETLSAQIAVLPLILAVFGRISIISPLANVLVVFMVPFAMAFSFVAGLLGIFFYPVGQFLGLFAWVTLEYIIKMTTLLARFPFASISFSQKTWLVSIFLYILVLVATYLFSKKYKLSLV